MRVVQSDMLQRHTVGVVCLIIYSAPYSKTPPALSVLLLDSKYQKAADSIETTQIQMSNGDCTLQQDKQCF